MKCYITALCCAALLLGGCKGRGSAVPATPTPSSSPIPSAITVTVLQGGIPQTNLAVVESSDYNTTTQTPIGVIQTINTDANGMASFAPGNPLSQYCFSTSVTVTGQSQPIAYHNCQQPLSDYSITFGS